MDWMKEPPKAEELADKDWASAPPRLEELKTLSDYNEPKYSAGQSAVMHGLNKLTGGLSDELQGVGEAAGRALGIQGAGGPMKDMHLAEGGPTIKLDVLKQAYLNARDRERQALKQQSQEHPFVSGAADIAGSVLSPINKIAKGLSIAKGGAALGGINAFGNSESDSPVGVAVDTGLGIGLGGLAGGLMGKAKDTLEDIATAPLNAPADRGLVASGLQKVGQAGQKANDLLDNVTNSKVARYLLPGANKVQAAIDAAQATPKAAQWAAGKAANGIDSAQKFLMQSPRLQGLAQTSPAAFSALASRIATGKGYDPSQPTNEAEARQSFLDGN